MRENSIPVYRICTLPGNETGRENVLIDRLDHYLAQHTDIKFPHRHSFYHFVLFTKGSGKHTIDFKEYELVPGQIYFMIPGQVHGWFFQSAVEGYVVHFETDFFSNLLSNHRHLLQFPMLQSHLSQQVVQLDKNTYQESCQLLEQLFFEYHGRKPFRKDMLQLLLLQLLTIIARVMPTAQLSSPHGYKGETVQEFIDLIEVHYTVWKHPKKYASELNVSANYLNQICNDIKGKSAGSLIRERQVLEAKRLLTNATLSIKEISGVLNFKDNSYFTKFFKKACGISPEEFRKSL